MHRVEGDVDKIIVLLVRSSLVLHVSLCTGFVLFMVNTYGPQVANLDCVEMLESDQVSCRNSWKGCKKLDNINSPRQPNLPNQADSWPGAGCLGCLCHRNARVVRWLYPWSDPIRPPSVPQPTPRTVLKLAVSAQRLSPRPDITWEKRTWPQQAL